jgi:archaellum component FlaC
MFKNKYTIVNKEDYEDLKEEHELLKEGMLECFHTMFRGGSYFNYYTFSIAERLDVVVKALKDTAKLYRDLTTFKESLTPAQWILDDLREQIHEMQTTIDEQATYITKMRKDYYISSKAMEEDK